MQYRFVTIMSARYGTVTLRNDISFRSVWFRFISFCFVLFGNVQRGELLQETRAKNDHSERAKARAKSMQRIIIANVRLVPGLRILRGDAHNCATLSYCCQKAVPYLP